MKTVIITGASGNLGTAVTHLFLSKGYKVIATVHNQKSKNELPEHENLFAEIVDLSNELEAAQFVKHALHQHNQIEAALLLVGGFAMGDIYSTSITDVRKQMGLNFDTAYNVVHPLFQHMISLNQGKIVFIGARPALQPAAGKKLIAYSLSKTLLFKLAELLNAEAKGKNVTASVVVPSTIDTPDNRESMPGADPDEWVKPVTIAEIIEFIVSEKAGALRETVLKVYNNA